jgi:hypothetical protein
MKKSLALFALASLLSGAAGAQDSVSFKLSPPPEKTQLAGVFDIKVEASFPDKYNIRPDTASLDNSDFSLVSLAKTGESVSGGLKTAVFVLKAQAFGLGISTFPAVSWGLYGPQGGPAQAEARTQPFTMQILPAFKEKAGDSAIKDIYAPYRYLPWLWILAGLLAAVAAWLAWRRFRKEKGGALAAAAWRDPRTPYQRARARLSGVEKAGLPGSGRLKEYYIGLTAILRFYLVDEFSINADLMTTSDLSRELKKTGADIKTTLSAREFLQKADLVKFARLKPEDAVADAKTLDGMLMEFTRASESAKAAAAQAAAEKAAAEKEKTAATKAVKKP